MAVLTDINPTFFKEWAVKVGTDDYRYFVDQFKIVPKVAEGSWRGGGNNTHADISVTGYSATVGYMQDWQSSKSFSRLLWENQGKTLEFVFEPTAGVGTAWTVDLTIVPGEIGGVIGSPGNVTVTLACASDPVPTPITPPAGG